MCILLKLHYAKFDVSRLFCSKVMEEKPLGGRSARPPPPLGKGKAKFLTISSEWPSHLSTSLIFTFPGP